MLEFHLRWIMNQIVEQINPETIALIESQARLAGLSIDDYLKSLMPNGTENAEERPLYETATPQERADAYLAWVEGHKSDAPALALEDISRETIY